MRNEVIEARGQSGVGLRIEFQWCTDRYGHTVSITDSTGAIIPLLKSIEGHSEDAWPPSPPLQSLSIETLPDGRRAALLVGMAGGSHWSASIESIAGQPALCFDLACRHSHSPNWLGSRYRRLAGAESKLTIRGEDVRVVYDTQDTVIKPTAPAVPAGTTRWKFAIRLESAEY